MTEQPLMGDPPCPGIRQSPTLIFRGLSGTAHCERALCAPRDWLASSRFSRSAHRTRPVTRYPFGAVVATTTVITVYADTLYDLARRFGIGSEELIRVNPGLDPWLPGAGKRIVIPGQHLLPAGPREGIVVNLPEHRLYYYTRPKRGAATVVITYPVGIGKMDWRDPPWPHARQPERKEPRLDTPCIDSK